MSPEQCAFGPPWMRERRAWCFSCAVFADVPGFRKSPANSAEISLFRQKDGRGTAALAYKSARFCLTAFGGSEQTIEGMKAGAYDYITKPFDPDEVQDARAIEVTGLSREVEQLRARADANDPDSSGGIIGQHPAMREAFKLVGKVAPTEASVLMVGESGTGKELVAQAIHCHSRRAAASSTTRLGANRLSRSSSSPMPWRSLLTVNCSPLGKIAMSNLALLISTPTTTCSIICLPPRPASCEPGFSLPCGAIRAWLSLATVRALTWRFGAWRPFFATVSNDSGENGLPRLSFSLVWDSSDKIQGDSNRRFALRASPVRVPFACCATQVVTLCQVESAPSPPIGLILCPLNRGFGQ